MNTEICLVAGPIRMDPRVIPGCGATARFVGLVRGEENGAEIRGIEYEAYEVMAKRVTAGILEALGREYPVELVRMHHRIGFVPVGEAAIIVEVHSKHRAEAFAVLTKFLDRLKQDVPIWKRLPYD